MKLHNILNAGAVTVIGNIGSFIVGAVAGTTVLKVTEDEMLAGGALIGTTMAGSYVTGIMANKAATKTEKVAVETVEVA